MVKQGQQPVLLLLAQHGPVLANYPQQALERFILRFGQFLLKPLQFLLPELINTLVIALGYRKAVIP
jgi:hypothetical protein